MSLREILEQLYTLILSLLIKLLFFFFIPSLKHFYEHNKKTKRNPYLNAVLLSQNYTLTFLKLAATELDAGEHKALA